jgi:glycosyltransferase involved in cell wall biosynthesis
VPTYSLIHGKNVGTLISTVSRLRTLIQEQEIAIVHAHQYAAGLYSRIASLGLNLPVIYHTHNTSYPMSLPRRWLDIWLTQVNTGVCIAVTQGMADNLAATNPLAAKKTQIFFNAINEQRLTVAPNYDRNLFRSEIGICEPVDLVVGTVGRLDRDKRYDVLLISFAKLLHTIPNAWLVIVGGGPLEAELRSIAVDLQVASQIIFTGYRNDIGQLMSAFDVFVISSETEAFPMVTLEALTCGIPVVMTEAVSAGEVLKDFTQVVAFDSGKIAEGILSLYLDPEKAKRQSERGCNFVKEQFSLSAYVDRLEKLYDSLLNDRQ